MTSIVWGLPSRWIWKLTLVPAGRLLITRMKSSMFPSGWLLAAVIRSWTFQATCRPSAGGQFKDADAAADRLGVVASPMPKIAGLLTDVRTGRHAAGTATGLSLQDLLLELFERSSAAARLSVARTSAANSGIQAALIMVVRASARRTPQRGRIHYNCYAPNKSCPPAKIQPAGLGRKTRNLPNVTNRPAVAPIFAVATPAGQAEALDCVFSQAFAPAARAEHVAAAWPPLLPVGFRSTAFWKLARTAAW